MRWPNRLRAVTTIVSEGQDSSRRWLGHHRHLLAKEIEGDSLRLQRIDAQYALGADMPPLERGGVDVANAPAAHLQRRDEHGLDPADLGHAVQPGACAEAQPKVAGQLLSDRGPLRARCRRRKSNGPVLADGHRTVIRAQRSSPVPEHGLLLLRSGRRRRLLLPAERSGADGGERGDR
jgi:hypothetical protein